MDHSGQATLPHLQVAQVEDLIKTGRKIDVLEKDLLSPRYGLLNPPPPFSSFYLYLTSTGIADPCFDNV